MKICQPIQLRNKTRNPQNFKTIMKFQFLDIVIDFLDFFRFFVDVILLVVLLSTLLLKLLKLLGDSAAGVVGFKRFDSDILPNRLKILD